MWVIDKQGNYGMQRRLLKSKMVMGSGEKMKEHAKEDV